MIKDVMVRLDGSVADEVRLAAVNDIAETFGSYITGLFINTVPILPLAQGSPSASHVSALIHEAKKSGDILPGTRSR